MPTNIELWQEAKTRYNTQSYQLSEVTEDIDESYVVPKLHPTTRYEFVRGDCVDAAINAKLNGFNPLMLNMASWFKPGGGVEKGATAQEEDLFRRSNYHKFLDRRLYPLPTYRTILSRGVEFFRRGHGYQYAIMQTPYTIDCVAAPAVRHPKLTSKDCLTKADREIMKRKINILCQIASKNGNDTLILSAWGCGAFYCPPEDMGSIFREVLREYVGCFKKIVFAILGDSMDNYGWFKKGFEEQVPQPK